MNIKSLMPFGRERASLARPEHASFSSLQREIDRLFEDFTRGFAPLSGSALIPSMDVSETEKEVEISAELPGLEENDVEVALEGDILTIKGEKKAEKTEEKGKDYRVTERSYGSFYRAIQLPHGIDAKDIKASMANGVLKITLPKPKRSNARKIAIKAKS